MEVFSIFVWYFVILKSWIWRPKGKETQCERSTDQKDGRSSSVRQSEENSSQERTLHRQRDYRNPLLFSISIITYQMRSVRNIFSDDHTSLGRGNKSIQIVLFVLVIKEFQLHRKIFFLAYANTFQTKAALKPTKLSWNGRLGCNKNSLSREGYISVNLSNA